jgi:hypothetical protein
MSIHSAVAFIGITSFGGVVGAQDCPTGGYAVGFFNGIWSDRGDAIDATEELASIIGPEWQGESIRFEAFYNHRGSGPVSGHLSDLAEVFRMQSEEFDSAGIAGIRFELLWEAAFTGDVRLAERLARSSDLARRWINQVRAEILTRFLSDALTQFDQPLEQRTRQAHRLMVDVYRDESRKVLFVAHSQGNLFANVAYTYASSQITRSAIGVEHIAPPTSTTSGYPASVMLSSNDRVIGAIRIRGRDSVLANTITIPFESPFAHAYMPEDWLGWVSSQSTAPLGHWYDPQVSKDLSGHLLLETYLDPDRNGRAFARGQLTTLLNALEEPACYGTCPSQGMTSPCYEGQDGTLGVGRCRGGIRTCLSNETWSMCQQQVVPARTEICGNAVDDDCDGDLNEGCESVCPTCTPECTGVATRQICGNFTGDACLELGPSTACTLGEVCTGQGVCNCADSCCQREGISAGGCCDGAVARQCSASGSCFVVASSFTCSGTCGGGGVCTPVCSSNYCHDSGHTSGSHCSGSDAVTCSSSGGCGVVVQSQQCTSGCSGGVCVTSQQPDLAIASSFNNQTVVGIGGFYSIPVTVSRTGGSLVGADPVVRIYLSVDSTITTSDYVCSLADGSGSFSLATLNSIGSASRNVSCVPGDSMLGPLSAGTYRWGAIVDPSAQHPESNESNNFVLGGAVTVL